MWGRAPFRLSKGGPVGPYLIVLNNQRTCFEKNALIEYYEDGRFSRVKLMTRMLVLPHIIGISYERNSNAASAA